MLEKQVDELYRQVSNKLRYILDAIYENWNNAKIFHSYGFIFRLIGLMFLYFPLCCLAIALPHFIRWLGDDATAASKEILTPGKVASITYCLSSIFLGYAEDFPIVKPDGEALNTIQTQVQQRPGFQILECRVVKDNSAAVDKIECRRLQILLQQYIDDALMKRMINGVAFPNSKGGFSTIYIDEVRDGGVFLVISVLWVDSEATETYIRQKKTPIPHAPADTIDKEF